MVVETVCTEKENLYYEMLPQLKAIAEVVEHIEAQHRRIPFAVVSGGTLESVVASLKAVNLLDKFDVFVCAGDYKKGKPDPEPFLLAAEKLGVNPKDCLVFEDTEMGIQAATAAGWRRCAFPPPWERSHAKVVRSILHYSGASGGVLGRVCRVCVGRVRGRRLRAGPARCGHRRGKC